MNKNDEELSEGDKEYYRWFREVGMSVSSPLYDPTYTPSIALAKQMGELERDRHNESMKFIQEINSLKQEINSLKTQFSELVLLRNEINAIKRHLKLWS